MSQWREFFELYKKQLIFGGLGLLAVLAILLVFQMTRTTPASATPETISSSGSMLTNSSSGSGRGSSTRASGPIYVDVKGAVKHPGIFQVSSAQRVNDAIRMAGGMTAKADQKQVNLAQRLTDQMAVYVPYKGEVKGNAAPTPGGGAPTNGTTSSPTGGSVNLNTADKTQLQQLDGVGEKKADKIIAYRTEHGQFSKIEDLKNIAGFGDKTFEKLKDHLAV